MKLEALRRLTDAPKETFKGYLARLSRLGIKRIGSGTHAVVFRHPTMPSVCVKITKNSSDNFFDYVTFCLRNPNNPWTPKVFEREPMSFADQPYCFATFMELLKPATEKDIVSAYRYIMRSCGLRGSRNHWSTLFYHMTVDVWRTVARASTDKNLRDLANFFVVNGALDLRAQNLMMRGSQLVFVDPVYE